MIPRARLVVTYATGRASHSRQVKGDDPDKKGYPVLPGWGLGMRLTTSPRKEISIWNLKRWPRPSQGCRANDDYYVWYCTGVRRLLRLSHYSFYSSFIVFYSILQYSFMFNQIQWIIPKKYLTQFLMCEERENQKDATIRCLLLTSASTCFGHHYAHLQENKDRVTAFGVLLCDKRENVHISSDVFFVG